MTTPHMHKRIAPKHLGGALLVTLVVFASGCASSGTATYYTGYGAYGSRYDTYYGAGWGDNYYDRRRRANFYYGRPRGYGGRW